MIFGFDFDYIVGRVDELDYECKGCKVNKYNKSLEHGPHCETNKFYDLGRFKTICNKYELKQHPNKRCKKIVKNLKGVSNTDDSDNSFMNDTLKYIHMDGRIIFDVQNEVKKGYSLDSYKLDNVSANFMRGKVKSIQSTYDDEDFMYVYIKTDRIGNLKEGDYISFNVTNNYGSLKYDNGKNSVYVKYPKDEDNLYTINIEPDDYIDEEKLLSMSSNDILYSEWCLNKDDISPLQLFHNHKWGDGKERGDIAKYCVMDCELCIHLLLMLDFIPNNIGMSNVCKDLSRICPRGQGIKVQSIVTKIAHENNYKLPTLMGYDEELSDNSGFEGAIVLDPKPGLYLDDLICGRLCISNVEFNKRKKYYLTTHI